MSCSVVWQTLTDVSKVFSAPINIYLMIEAVSTSEMLVSIHQTTRHNISEDSHLLVGWVENHQTDTKEPPKKQEDTIANNEIGDIQTAKFLVMRWPNRSVQYKIKRNSSNDQGMESWVKANCPIAFWAPHLRAESKWGNFQTRLANWFGCTSTGGQFFVFPTYISKCNIRMLLINFE
jgi:hypothetical protein